MTKVRHILGISGGKDSAALAIYLKKTYPSLKIEYYNSDTGCELAETETLINRLEAYLGKIERLRAAEGSPEPTPFHHFVKAMGGFLPSPQARWCTKKMKLDKFEEYVGDDYAVSYVGIRGDEDRDGYISSKPNIQAIFPFRKNIWSIDVINKFLHKENLDQIVDIYERLTPEGFLRDEILETVKKPITKQFYYSKSALGAIGVKNKVMTAIRMEPIGEFYTKWKAIEAMEQGQVCIFSAGTGSPYFTTDTGSSLRGIEIEADVMLKGTRVDGIYTADPEKDPTATKFNDITYKEVLARGLKVMDLTAICMCQDNNLPIYVFNMDVVGNLKKVMAGEEIGTLVHN